MNEFWVKVIINIVIGLVVIIGFFIFWGKSSGIFNEGGFISELIKMIKEKNKKNGKDDL